jgi:hypothetical protein
MTFDGVTHYLTFFNLGFILILSAFWTLLPTAADRDTGGGATALDIFANRQS